MRILAAAILLALMPATVLAAPSQASPPISASENGIAIDGFDAVSYFSDGGPVVGSAAYEYR
jgi:hypothetical protein